MPFCLTEFLYTMQLENKARERKTIISMKIKIMIKMINNDDNCKGETEEKDEEGRKRKEKILNNY